jgi:archaellum component FlaC
VVDVPVGAFPWHQHCPSHLQTETAVSDQDNKPWEWGDKGVPQNHINHYPEGTRFLCCGYDGHMNQFSQGNWVRHEDYAKLKMERIHDLNQIGGLQEDNARLKAEVERLDTLCKQLMAQHSDISCENIMLRKANDQLAEVRELHAGFNRALFNETVTENASLKAEVERLTKQNALATPRHLIASQDIKTLREQIEELKLENSQYEEHHKYGQNVITSLREEVERLTDCKAQADRFKAEVERLNEAIVRGAIIPDPKPE